MRLVRVGATLRRGLAAMAGLALLGLSGPASHITAFENSTEEIRALWVLRSSLTSPESIRTLVDSARDHGFNTLLVQVRGRGDAYFNGGTEPRAAELHRQPLMFDPLDSVLTLAHDAGLRVHAWVNVNLVSSATDLPSALTHLVHRHPDWLMVPRDIAQELARVEEGSPAYLGKLARWTRGQPAGVEGLYMSPVLPAAVDYVDALVRDLATRYALDGVHLDYARYPNDRFDYSRAAIRAFRATVRPHLPPGVRKDSTRARRRTCWPTRTLSRRNGRRSAGRG